MPTLPEQANPTIRPSGFDTANLQPVAPGGKVRVAVQDPPSFGNSVDDWLQYLTGQRAVLDKAMRDVQAAIDALEQTAPRAATHDWQTILTPHVGWGGLGMAWSTSAWTEVDAEIENFSTQAYDHEAGALSLYVLMQVPRTLDVDRLRIQQTRADANLQTFPHAASEWQPFSGSVANATGTDNYYVLEIVSSSIQFGIGMMMGDRLLLQEDHGTPASVWIPDGSLTAAMLDADTPEKQQAFRTALAIMMVGGGALTDDSVEPRHLDADDATKQAAFRARLGLVTTQGHTITDDSILPAWLRADSAEQKGEFRTRINAKANPSTIQITVGSADNAMGTSPDSSEAITVPVNERFIWRTTRTERRYFWFITLPSGYRPISIIGESGETIDDWEKQAGDLTWSLGPLTNAGRDPETFYILVEPTSG